MKNALLVTLTTVLISFSAYAQPWFERIKDIRPGGDNSHPSQVYSHNGKLFFTANDGISHNEPWVYDQASHNSYLLKDIFPGYTSSQPWGYFGHNGKVYFYADDNVTGFELYITDGTPAGTYLLKDINPSGSSFPKWFTVFNNKVYFSANDGNGYELWETDGTEAGTQMAFGFQTTAGSNPSNMTVFNNKLYYSASETFGDATLYETDGTLSGTRKVVTTDTIPTNVSHITVSGGKLYFTANSGINNDEPWVSDGTEAGTYQLKNTTASQPSGASTYTEFGTQTIFYTNNFADGIRLWITDGTEAGTIVIKDIGPPGSGGTPIIYNSKIYYAAKDGNAINLWVSDGTASGTQVVSKNFHTISALTVFNGYLYFSAIGTGAPYSHQLWRTKGTEATSEKLVPVQSINPNALEYCDKLAKIGHSLYYNAGYDGLGYELWALTAFPDHVTETGKPNVLLYPNPVTDILNIKLNDNKQAMMRLLSATGQICLQQPINKGKTAVNIENLPAGVYFLYIIKENGISIDKIIKQ